MRRYRALPVDEVALARRARPFVDALAGELPDADLLAEVARAHGLDLAAMVFYRAVLDSPVHGALARRLDAVPLPPEPPPAAFGLLPKLLVVPAFFHRERPDLGGDGRLVVEIARACGLEAAVVPVGSRATAAANAGLVWEAIDRDPAPAVWLFSMSKGGPEARLALEDHAGHPALGKVRGWVSVSGMVRGCHMVDDELATPARRLRARTVAGALGIPFAAVKELATANPRWRRPLALPPGLPVVNLVGVPLASHLQKAIVPRYLRLGRLGPNDGFVLLPELLVLPGLVHPVWGTDHLFRTPQVSPLLYRLFTLLRQGALAVPGSRATG